MCGQWRVVGGRVLVGRSSLLLHSREQPEQRVGRPRSGVGVDGRATSKTVVECCIGIDLGRSKQAATELSGRLLLRACLKLEAWRSGYPDDRDD